MYRLGILGTVTKSGMEFVSTRNCGELTLEQTAQKNFPFFPYPIN